MCRFVQITSYPKSTADFYSHYIHKILNCYDKYLRYLQDDFANTNSIEIIMSKIPYLWAICDRQYNFMGFAFLDNFVGNDYCFYSAELTVAFRRCAWGNFTKYSGKIFLKKCFDTFGFQKIKAQVYPDNARIKQLLKSTGFSYTVTLPAETLRKGRQQDIDVYTLNRDYYKKKENKYDKNN